MAGFGPSLVQRLATSDVRVTENCVYWKPVIISSKFRIKMLGAMPSDRLCRSYSNDPGLEEVDSFFSGRAVNQYFIHKRLAETASSTLWRCFDVVNKEFCCIKLYYIAACKKERSVRFFREDTEVISVLDKIIDEIIYHSALQACPGVSRVREVIVDLENEVILFVMSYYPSQLMYYDFESNAYCVPYSGHSVNNRYHNGTGCNHHAANGTGPSGKDRKYLYTEEAARRIMRELVKTVTHLYQNGLIHKDIKPDNLLLTRIDQNMFQPFEYPDSTGPSFETGDDFTANVRVDDVEEAFHHMDWIKSSDTVYFKMDSILGYRPRRFRTQGFPYSFSNHFDFFFTMWDDCETVTDYNRLNPKDREYVVGRNALLFAAELSRRSKARCTDLASYFLRDHPKVPYRVNRNFTSGDDKPLSPLEDNYEPLVVVTDFGVASVAEEESGGLVIFDSEGTISFTSPECLKYIDGAIPASGRDVFSLGVTLYCMVYGKLPYYGNNSIEMLINILETPLLFHPYRKISPELQNLLGEMLHKDHLKRIKLDSILSHSWFR